MRASGTNFVIPAPAMVELEAGGHASMTLAHKLESRQRQLQIEAFDNDAVKTAGKMLRSGHKAMVKENPGVGRRAIVKYDAMIAAMAHVKNANRLVTTNPADFIRFFKEVGSAVEVIDSTDHPEQGVLGLSGVS